MSSFFEAPNRRLGVMVLAGHLALFGSVATGQEAARGKPPAPASTSLGTLVFVPHDYSAPEVTESGGARGLHGDQGLGVPRSLGRTTQAAAPPALFVLAPPRLARTLSSQPTLYWYVSGPTDAPVRLTLLDVDATDPKPLLELRLDGVAAQGVYALSLAEQGIRLEKGRRYEWSVALEVDPGSYSGEPVARTIFDLDEGDPALLAQIEGNPPLVRLQALAGAGYWYDAIDLLAVQIAANDPTEPWQELRADLLDQVGLDQPAAFDRAGIH